MANEVTITATFSDSQAWALVRFLNQVGHKDLMAFAVGDKPEVEAYSMLEACEVIRKGLANEGYDLLW